MVNNQKKDKTEEAIQNIENEMSESDERTQNEDENTEEERNHAEKLLALVTKSGAKLFHDQFKSGCIAKDGSGTSVLKLRSKEFKSWLANQSWKILHKPAGGSTIDTVVRTLEGRAIHECEQIELHVRVAAFEGSLWYDLGNGNAVEITKEKWQVNKTPPILFSHFSHQQPQVIPISGSDLNTIYEFIPSPKDSRQRLLTLVWLVSAILTGFPHPILVVHGPQGSRKTTFLRLLRRLIDPSVMETLLVHGDNKEYVQLASHHYLLPLDNLSVIKSEFSDILCRTVTGDGMSKRELFSDDDDVIYSFRRVIAMNGINLVVSKPDLLERSLIIELARPEVYEKEVDLFKRFEQARPQLLGAIFDVVQKSIQIFETMEVPKTLGSFRMADFAHRGCAISQALGYKPEEFLEALKYNLVNQNAEAIDDSTVAQLVIAFMQDRPEYEATPTDLLQELKKLAEKLDIDVKGKDFPKKPNWLWRKLEVVATNLLALGIKVERGKDVHRLIRLSKTDQSGVSGVPVVQDNGPDDKGYDFNEIPNLFSSPDSTDSKDSTLEK